MAEREDTAFPRNLYHETYGVIEVESQETMDLAIERGFKRVPPALNTIPKLEKKIAEVEAELKELKENLAAKKHETEIAIKAEEILEKMRTDAAEKDAEAQRVAEEQAAKEEKEAEEKAAAEAKAKAEAELGAASVTPPPAAPTSAKIIDSAAARLAEHTKGMKK